MHHHALARTDVYLYIQKMLLMTMTAMKLMMMMMMMMMMILHMIIVKYGRMDFVPKYANVTSGFLPPSLSPSPLVHSLF